MIKEITQFISDETTLIIGTDLFCGHRPQTAQDRCHVVLETAGGGLYYDLPDRVDKMIQIISRAKTYFTARDDAQAVFDLLHGRAGCAMPVITSGIEYEAQTIEAVADPQYIGQDEKGRYEFSTNYIFRIKDV